MTVMSTNTRELNINQLLLRAAQVAGIMPFELGQDSGSPQWLAKASFGRDQLELVMKSLPNEGIITRNVSITSFAVSVGTTAYVQSAGTIDVIGKATFALDSQPTIEYPMRQVDREEWMVISQKSLSARPTEFWVEKTSSVTVHLYPTPNEAGTARVQRRALLADNSDGNATVDAEPYWQDYLVKELAYRYSVGMPLNERALLRRDADAAKAAAQAQARQMVANSIELYHPTPWNR